MKKLLVATVIFLTSLCLASSDVAERYVTGLFRGEFDEIYHLQDEAMKKAQPVSVLKNLKTQLDFQLGKLKMTLDVQQVEQGELVSYVMITEFDKGIFDIIVTLNAQERVAGFFIRPSTYQKTETPSAQMKTGDEVVDEYLSGFFAQEYESAYELQNEKLKEAQSIEILREVYTQLKSQLGDPRQTLNVEKLEKDGFTTYVMPTKFDNGVFDVTVTLDSENRVAGFFVRPSSYSSRPLPEYAAPSSYTEQDITVGKEPYYLPAKLTVPNDLESYPLVIILQGSGTHDVDGTLGENKPYRDIAVGLASNGIAVLRYPKRYFVYPDKVAEIGISAEAEYVEDALTIIEQMRGVAQFDKLFLAGHSLGGMMTPAIAERAGADGMILLSAAPVKLAQVSLDQNLDLGRDQLDEDQKAQLIDFFEKLLAQQLPADTDLGQGITAGYYYSLDDYFAMPVLEETEMPVLIVNAELDFQTPRKYFDTFLEELANKPNVTLKLLPGLNHIFNETDGTIKSIEEYNRPGYVSFDLIELIADWVKKVS